MVAVKIILRYLKDIVDYGKWYPKINNFTLRPFTDANWAGSIDERKSTSGATFYLGDYLVSLISKKWSSISLSTVEAKYIVDTSCCTQFIWMKQKLEDLLVKYEDPIVINYDNNSAINISKNPIMHSKTKHNPIKYHF